MGVILFYDRWRPASTKPLVVLASGAYIGRPSTCPAAHMSQAPPPPAAPQDDDAKWEQQAWARAQAQAVARPDPLSVRGENAVWSRNLPALEQALAEGWSLPVFNRGADRGHDLGMVFGVVTAGWLEGWQVLRQRWPELADNEQLLLAALTAVRPKIVEDILSSSQVLAAEATGVSRAAETPSPRLSRLERAPGLTLTQPVPHAEKKEGLLLVHHLFSSLSREVGEPPAEQDLIDCARSLAFHGVRVDAPYPGRFEPEDLSLPGHTLWSLAVRERKWDLALALAPDSITRLHAHPRWRETLDDWFECAWHGARILTYRAPPSPLAQAAWQSSVAPLIGAWLDVSDTLLRPEGWPALLGMSPANRVQVWDYLLKLQEMNGLNWLAMSAGEHLAQARQLLALAFTEVPDRSSLLAAWSRTEPAPSPALVWSQQTGQPMTAEWPQDARVPDLMS